MSAGYSGTPLVKKLGIRPGMRVWFVNTPADYEALIADLPAGLERIERSPASMSVDFIHLFTHNQADFEQYYVLCRDALKPDGMLWVSWPKKASKVPTDLNEDVIRNYALANGLVDVKVAAVDVTWSALKLVYRLKDRP